MSAVKTIAGLIVAITVLGVMAGNHGSSSPPPNAGPALQASNWQCTTEYSYRKLTGEVKNITDKPLSNVEAVGIFQTGNDQFVKSDSAIIEYNPIMPGQSSPFTIITTDNPMISRCSLAFKNLFGSSIAFK